jgi:hypothetical protein
MTPHATGLPALVDDMLAEAGHREDAELRAALFSLGSLASLPAPAPSAELARLMAGAGKVSPSVAPAYELARRRRRRIHRPTALGLALVAGMATGIGGVAASSQAPVQAGSSSVQELLEGWRPSWNIAAPGDQEIRLPDTSGVAPGVAAADPVTDGATVPAEAPHGQPAAQQPAPRKIPGTPAPDQQTRQGNGGVASAGRQNNPQAPAQERGGPDGQGTDPPGAGQSRGDSLPGEEKLVGQGSLTEDALKPLAEVLQSVNGVPATGGRPAPGDSWLQKFNR